MKAPKKNVGKAQWPTKGNMSVEGKSYNEIDNNIRWSPDPSVEITAGDRYLNHSPIFRMKEALPAHIQAIGEIAHVH